jgi:hypothetical protein
MKDLISALKALIILAFLIAFLFIALQFRSTIASSTKIAGAPIAAKPTHQAYPPSQNDIFSTPTEANSYPYPAPDGNTKMVQTIDCSKVGTWVEYNNKEAGYSFQYPAESEIFTSIDNNGYTDITLFLKPYCYATHWWGPTQVTISVLDNNTKLSLRNFVVKQFSFDASADYSALSQELGKNSETVSVDQITALRVNGKMTREMPYVYIPYSDNVIFVGLTETTYMPPFEPACPAMVALYNKILASVKFLRLGE